MVCWWSFSRGHLRVRSRSGCHAPTPAIYSPLTESLTAAATMSSVRGSCDEVEFLYSKPAYVSWVPCTLENVETGLAANRFSASAAERTSPA